MVVQLLRLHVSTAGGMGSIPGGGAKVLFTVKCSQKIYMYNKNKHMVGGRKSKSKGLEAPVNMATVQLVKGAQHQVQWKGMQGLDYVQSHQYGM